MIRNWIGRIVVWLLEHDPDMRDFVLDDEDVEEIERELYGDEAPQVRMIGEYELIRALLYDAGSLNPEKIMGLLGQVPLSGDGVSIAQRESEDRVEGISGLLDIIHLMTETYYSALVTAIVADENIPDNLRDTVNELMGGITPTLCGGTIAVISMLNDLGALTARDLIVEGVGGANE